VPLMLTVANGLISVPSPLKLIPSTMAFGIAAPPTMFHPCVAKRYDPCRVYTPQLGTLLSARAVPDVIATAPRVASPHVNSKELIIFLSNLVFIVVVSFCFCCFGLLWLLIVRSQFQPFTPFLSRLRRKSFRKFLKATTDRTDTTDEIDSGRTGITPAFAQLPRRRRIHMNDLQMPVRIPAIRVRLRMSILQRAQTPAHLVKFSALA
jgi:hypothetical protein